MKTSALKVLLCILMSLPVLFACTWIFVRTLKEEKMAEKAKELKELNE